jgi:hypothetical protein
MWCQQVTSAAVHLRDIKFHRRRNVSGGARDVFFTVEGANISKHINFA